MSFAHTHAHGSDLGPRRRRGDAARRMWIALAINIGMLVVAIVGGILTGSLAVLADAGHVLSDVGAISLGLLAGGIAGRSGGARQTFGLGRTEVLAALINGVALVVVGVLIIVAAIGRFSEPPEIEGLGVVAVGVIGLAGNVAATIVLARGERDDLNLEAVLRHSAADALGSLAVIISGAVLLATDWTPIDPIVSLTIAALILAGSVRLIREPIEVLLESAPRGIDVEDLARKICAVEGVVEVHDLHVWTLTSQFDALAAHVVVREDVDRDLVRSLIASMLVDQHRIEHTTLQMESPDRPPLLDIATESPGAG